MVDVCWVINPSKCRDHGPGRTCKIDGACFYKTVEAEKLLARLHGLLEAS